MFWYGVELAAAVWWGSSDVARWSTSSLDDLRESDSRGARWLHATTSSADGLETKIGR